MVFPFAKFRLLWFLAFTSLFAEPVKDEMVSLFDSGKVGDSYTINYNTISMLEYIRFTSKICTVNFIYNEADLNFNVSVVSDAPITPENVMATLVQVLRINGLMLIEQDNNLVIHKSAGVRQLATIVTDGKQEGKSAIVTRIFRVKNTKADAVAAIIRPMISVEALLETSQETRQIILTDVTANVDKVAALIEILDSPVAPLEIKSYEIVYNAPEFLIEMANQILAPLAQGNPLILVPQPLANAIFIVSTPELVNKSLSILASLDTAPKRDVLTRKALRADNIFLYKAMNRPSVDLLQDLNAIGADIGRTGIPEGDLLETIKSARHISDTNSLVFVGSSTALEKIKEFLASLDVVGGEGRSSFFVYKPQHRTAEDLEKALLEMASHLKGSDESLVETLRSVRINTSTNMLVFSGSEKDFPRIKELLSAIDTGSGKPSQKTALLANTFFVYKPKVQRGEILAASVKEIYNDLKEDHFTDPAFLQTLRSMRWVKANNSLLFTGDANSVKRLEELMASLDTTGSSKLGERSFLLYHPDNVTQGEMQDYLSQIADNLAKKGVDEDLVSTIRSKKWVEPSLSFMFQGSSASLTRLKELLTEFDVPENRRESKSRPNYFIYKLQNTTGDVIEDEFESLAKNLSASGMQHTKLYDVIEHMRYVKETNSIILTGDPKGIEEAKKLIAEYDFARTPFPKGDAPSSFILYKPQHQPHGQIEKSLREVAANLKKADLADPTLLATIESSRYVEATNSIVFTGPPDTLKKLQTLLTDVDVPASNSTIQHVGATTFLLYKLKNATGSQMMASLKTLACDLKKSGATDKEFIAALQGAKYIKESNSILFTGNESTLSKIEPFIEKFDLAGTGLSGATAGGATDFIVYRPNSITGPDLEKIMQDFTDNLKNSGLSDPDLFAALQSMSYLEATQSLVFTGSPKALTQVKELLTAFDIPSNATAIGGGGIQAVDNTSFLVYKLQYHKGEEIQSALRQIAKDLIGNNAPVNHNLLNSINSIQWLDVTNSLLCSGDQETLVRLKELIKNLDVPLKQVYIEMLVIETTLANALQFGLEWGGKYKYRNKFQSGFGNSTPATGSQTSPDTTMTALNNFIPSIPMSSLTPQIAPTTSGNFDLGIIGQVIKHNGDTFLSLGSLLSALQTDTETSVIITPKIIAQDGHTSTVFHGQNIPFVGSFVNNTQGNATLQTSNLEYRDVGVSLTITPVLGNSDIVTLDISLDRTNTIGDVTGASINFNQNTAQGISTTRTTMQTTVHVPDRNFLILSGFVNNSNLKQRTGIPCLGGLPLIGAAFSQDETVVSNANIVIFLRPHIINSVDDLRQLSRDEEDSFRDQQGTPFLIQQFNEGMELIKSVDDE